MHIFHRDFWLRWFFTFKFHHWTDQNETHHDWWGNINLHLSFSRSYFHHLRDGNPGISMHVYIHHGISEHNGIIFLCILCNHRNSCGHEFYTLHFHDHEYYLDIWFTILNQWRIWSG